MPHPAISALPQSRSPLKPRLVHPSIATRQMWRAIYGCVVESWEAQPAPAAGFPSPIFLPASLLCANIPHFLRQARRFILTPTFITFAQCRPHYSQIWPGMVPHPSLRDVAHPVDDFPLVTEGAFSEVGCVHFLPAVLVFITEDGPMTGQCWRFGRYRGLQRYDQQYSGTWS